MQRFRLMNFYLAFVLLLVLLTIGGETWLRRPVAAATDPNTEQSATSIPATMPDGQGQAARDRFADLQDHEQDQILEFIKSL